MSTGIIAFAFGQPYTIKSNEILATLTTQKAIKLNAPVYTQGDLMLPDDEIDVTFIREVPFEPPPTLRIANGASRWIKERKISDILIIAATPHFERCYRDLKYILQEKNIPSRIHKTLKIKDIPNEVWFSKQSQQTRTQSPLKWWSREIILRTMPFALYKKVAG